MEICRLQEWQLHQAFEFLKSSLVLQEYFLLKACYLLLISATKEERKKYREEFLKYKKYIKKNIRLAIKNPYLAKKDKIVLCISALSINLSRVLYIIKNR